MAEAASLETTIRAECDDCGHGPRTEERRRISLCQRHRRLLRLDTCAFCGRSRFYLDRRTGLRLARALAELYDDAIRPQGGARGPRRHLSQFQKNWVEGVVYGVCRTRPADCGAAGNRGVHRERRVRLNP